ncbi:MAG: UDP-N-acetylmuramoyl-L-alanyl-D-glutamate--2,6-diaminopimelate ligase [Planctomycetota bacterium]
MRDDSRLCEPGDIFVAISGTNADGRRFVDDALARGAVAIAAETDPGAGAPWLAVPCARTAAGRIADLLYGDPSALLSLVGITGTNGKTTIAHLLAQLLDGPVGVIGTLGITYPGVAWKTRNTTPGPIELREALREMEKAGCRTCVMEVSSHALVQRRVDGLRFAAAVYSNLSGDHLDYHGTLEHYAAAKARLFALLAPAASAILNDVDPCRSVETPAERRIFRADDIDVSVHGTEFTWNGRRVRTPLVGEHNAQNAAAALETAVALGVEIETAIERLAGVAPVRGRLEVIARDPVLALVDYAHTDDALEHALLAVRALDPARLTVVFGCGGDRDKSKRPRMGQVAARLADRVILTNDNPRSEDPARIVEEIQAGMPAGRAEVHLDRRRAIEEAMAGARSRECVLVAGKGHETDQVLGARRVEFDDAAEVRRALAARAATALNHG